MRYLVRFTAGFAIACFLCCYGTWYFAAAAAVGILFLVFLQTNPQRMGSFLLLAGCISGIVCFCVHTAEALSLPRQLDGTIGYATVTATEYSVQQGSGSTVRGTLSYDGEEIPVVAYIQSGKHLLPGTVLRGNFRFRCTAGGKQTDTFHKGNGVFLLAYAQGECGIEEPERLPLCAIAPYMRRQVLLSLDATFPEETQAFAKALFLGEDDDLTYAQAAALSVTGIRHIVAVSGLHVTIFFAMICLVTAKRPVLTTILGLPILLVFASVAGFSPSIVRACVMQALFWIARCWNREYDGPTALAAGAFVLMIGNPWTVTSVSFQLSFGCIAGIFLFYEKLHIKLLQMLGGGKGTGFWKKTVRFLASSTAVSVSANAFILPLVGYYFGCISLVGILVNLLVLWLIPFAFGGVLVCAMLGCFWQAGGVLLARIVSVPLACILGVSEYFSKLPLAAVYTQAVPVAGWVAASTLLLGVYLLGKQKHTIRYIAVSITGLAVAILLAYLPPINEEYRMTVLDVGQGQAILLQSDGRTYLVDCGGDKDSDVADSVAEALLSRGIHRLDGMILSHFDRDHVNGAELLLSRIPADVVFLPAMSNNWAQTIRQAASDTVYTVIRDMEITFGGTQMTIFASNNLDSDNESSLCVLFHRKNCDILITGDRHRVGELSLLQSGKISHVDVLVAGHHGSSDSSGEAFLAALRPETVVISVGADNWYGHPAPQTLERFSRYGCTVYRTDLQGTIVIRG